MTSEAAVELEQHRRYQLPLSLLYLDIDHFKAINDQRGQAFLESAIVNSLPDGVALGS